MQIVEFSYEDKKYQLKKNEANVLRMLTANTRPSMGFVEVLTKFLVKLAQRDVRRTL